MRETWGTRSGFVLATIGSAVGLGNIWRFAYVAGENGGGAFVLVYLLLVAVIGLPLVIAELAIGKRGEADAVTAFERLIPHSAWRHAGWIGVAGSVLIVSYYSAIAGWALRYFVAAASGALWSVDAQQYGDSFARFIASGIEPVGWQIAMLLAAMVVVGGGVGGGIERANRVLMPLLALLLAGLAAFALSLPGAERGVAFLLEPDWSAIADPAVLLAALGQAFFSVGVGMAVFVTYGSYMPRDFGIPGSALLIVAGDTLFAIVAGLAIFPAVFAFGGDPRAGPELAFVTLPQVFAAMTAGRIVAPVFFFLLCAAALTSMVAMLEVSVATLIHRLGTRRDRAVLSIGAAALLLGAPSALGYGPLADIRIFGLPILDAADGFVSNFVLPLAGIGVAVVVGWVVPRHLAYELAGFRNRFVGRLFGRVLRIAPFLLLGLVIYRLVAS